MGTVLTEPHLSKSKFLNWIKAALAVLFTKEEMEPVVIDEIEQFQQKCLRDIATSNCLPAESTCTSCFTENVITCPTDGLCNIKGGKCRYHKNASLKYRHSGCPNTICHIMKLEIQNAHRYDGPSYKNTNATQWCNNPWEIAKCYMPDGYNDVSTAAETDFNGIISVIINHKGFDAMIKDDLSKRNNIFVEARKVSNVVRHCSNLEVEDVDLLNYFVSLNNILTDQGFITHNKSPGHARKKLANLQNDDLIIGHDVVRKVLEDAGEVIQTKIRNEIDENKTESEKRKQELIDIMKIKVGDIEEQSEISSAKLNEILKKSCDALEVKLQKSVEKIESKTEQMIEKIEDVLTGGIHSKEKLYQTQKQELKSDLIEFYKRTHNAVPLSPLIEEIETPLAGFYVMPDMVLVERKSFTSEFEERSPINSLRDLLTPGRVGQQEIYLSADAGFGKTSFSKYLASTWCQLSSPDENLEYFKDDELKALSSFDFLFLILLRHSPTVCSIDKMIELQIINKLSPKNAHYQLQDVLHREKCLIVLDGLDEWIHPDDDCPEKEESIPHRYIRNNHVLLTTTRPWKLGVLNLKTNQINKKVELVQLNQECISQLEKHVVRRMTTVCDDGELNGKIKDFDKVIRDRGLMHMKTIPLLLMYLLCLWCNKIPIGNSRHEVYVDIIEFLLSRTAQRNSQLKQSQEPHDGDIPEFFKGHEYCNKFYAFITSLAELAYHTLFNERREDTLVFDGSITEKYLKPAEMEMGLSSGILTASNTKTLVKRTSKVSFSHKTIQEFFAALYISSQKDVQNKVQKRCTDIQCILDFSVMSEFLSKMNAPVAGRVLNSFMSMINESKEIDIYRTRTGDDNISHNLLYGIQKMFLSCFREMPDNENVQLWLHDFFIDNDDWIHDRHLRNLSKFNNHAMKSLYINTWNAFRGLSKIDDLFSLKDLKNLQKLSLNCAQNEVEIDLSASAFPCLTSLTLMSGKLTHENSKMIPNLVRFQYLHIDHFKISHSNLEIFFAVFSGRKAIKELTLLWLSCEEHGFECRRWNFDLTEYYELGNLSLGWLPPLQLYMTAMHLVEVRLFKINLDENSLLLSRAMKNIKRVTLEGIEMSSESFQHFIEVLEILPHSVTVSINNCRVTPKEEYKRVTKRIFKSELFSVIEDESPKILFQRRRLNTE